MFSTINRVMVNPETDRPICWQDGDINHAFRLYALDKLPWDEITFPERYAQALSRAEEVADIIGEALADLIPSTTDRALVVIALTKVFFTFSNPFDPVDSITEEQLVSLCAAPDEDELMAESYAERLDTIATYLYGYGSEEFLGPWQQGVTCKERFTYAVERYTDSTR